MNGSVPGSARARLLGTRPIVRRASTNSRAAVSRLRGGHFSDWPVHRSVPAVRARMHDPVHGVRGFGASARASWRPAERLGDRAGSCPASGRRGHVVAAASARRQDAFRVATPPPRAPNPDCPQRAGWRSSASGGVAGRCHHACPAVHAAASRHLPFAGQACAAARPCVRARPSSSGRRRRAAHMRCEHAAPIAAGIESSLMNADACPFDLCDGSGFVVDDGRTRRATAAAARSASAVRAHER